MLKLVDGVCLIGLAGMKGSGKTTAAETIQRNYFSYRVVNFADPLKEGVCAMFGWTLAVLNDPKLKETVDSRLGFSPRKAMQVIGTDAVRNILGERTWEKLLYSKLMELTASGHDKIIVGDIRFETEAALIRTLGGLVIHVEAHNFPEKEQLDSHASEQVLSMHSLDKVWRNTFTPGGVRDTSDLVRLVFEWQLSIPE